jgi:glycosyltransferase involved in cell wall biosynthesis
VRQVVAQTLRHVDAVIVIDDGSTDGTAEALSDLGARILRHAENLGKGQRLVEGLEAAFQGGATQVITLDADGQHDPMDIPAFLARAHDNPGAMILGDRSNDYKSMPRTRAFGNGFGSFFVSWACARKLRDAQCGMRLYPLEAWRKVRVPPRHVDGFLFETAVLLYAADADVPFVSLPITARYEGHVHRPSHFDPVNDLLKIAGMVTGFLFSHRLRLRGLLVSLHKTMESNKRPQGN